MNNEDVTWVGGMLAQLWQLTGLFAYGWAYINPVHPACELPHANGSILTLPALEPRVLFQGSVLTFTTLQIPLMELYLVLHAFLF